MNSRTLALRAPLALLAGMAMLSRPSPVSAQAMSKWGHPVFSVGATPYYSHDAGHGNYPGGDGFTPGYGYYPGPFPSHYPWLDGPEGPGYPQSGGLFHHPAPAAATGLPPEAPLPTLPAAPADAAVITCRVPADATIWFDDAPTRQPGSLRRFVTPALGDGIYSYEIRARWKDHGTGREQSRTIQVRRGDRLTVDFVGGTAADTVLGQPRPVALP